MAKKFLEKGQKMNPAVFVEHIADLLDGMVNREASGPGDTLNAMRRLSTRHGIPFSRMWSFRYDRPKSVDVAFFCRVCEIDERARRREIERRGEPDSVAAARAFMQRALLRGAASLHGDAAAVAGSAVSDEGGARALDRLAARVAGDDDWPVIPG